MFSDESLWRKLGNFPPKGWVCCHRSASFCRRSVNSSFLLWTHDLHPVTRQPLQRLQQQSCAVRACVRGATEKPVSHRLLLICSTAAGPAETASVACGRWRNTLEIFLLEKQRYLQLEPSVDECLSSEGRVLLALYVIVFGVILHRALDVIRDCFLNASLVAPLPLLRGCPPQQPGSFILKTLGSRRGAASNEIRGRCIDGRRHAQFPITFPCCAPFVLTQNGAAALQHPGGRLPATFPGGNAHGWRERSQCVCDCCCCCCFLFGLGL